VRAGISAPEAVTPAGSTGQGLPKQVAARVKLRVDPTIGIAMIGGSLRRDEGRPARAGGPMPLSEPFASALRLFIDPRPRARQTSGRGLGSFRGIVTLLHTCAVGGHRLSGWSDSFPATAASRRWP
jgi:hypothetical protein